ncbi:MAG: hypothetical protein V4702_06375 [Patescibacteria group bacterium]
MACAELSVVQNALFSVHHKPGLEVMAGGLLDLEGEQWNIIASGGTADYLAASGIPVTPTAEFVGGGAILGHKVVTLSREIAAGLIANYSPEDTGELEANDIPRIHLVENGLYPLELAIAEHGDNPAKVREMTDVGGRALLMEGDKGQRIVISRPDQRQDVLEWLQAGRPDAETFLMGLESDAEYEVARYSFLRAQYLDRLLGRSSISGFIGRRVATTKYGENPHQRKAGVFADNRVNVNPLGIDQFEHVKGWEESYVNEIDIFRLTQTSIRIAAGFERNFAEVPPMAVGVKHGNACGAGVAETHAEAVRKMIEGDTRAIHGGVIMINGEIDSEIAEILMRHMVDEDDPNRLLDGVVGASVTEEALEILSRSKLRVVVNPALSNLGKASIDTKRQMRFLGDAVLEQDPNTFVMDFSADYMEQYGELTEQQKRDLILAWGIGSTSNSNTITLVKNGMLIGNGVGQQDRVGAGQLALSRTSTREPLLDDVNLKALTPQEAAFFEKIISEGLTPDDLLVMSVYLDRTKIEGAVAYSDSFYPYEDGPALLAKAGIKAMLTSWNTQRHKDILSRVHATGVSIAMIPDKVGRGFAEH